jgi:hypothetical protein
MEAELIGFLVGPAGNLKDLLSADENEFADRLDNFIELCKKDPDKANNVISDNNLQKSIVLTPQNFLEEKPFSVFDEIRYKFLSGFKESLAKLQDSQELLHRARMQEIIRNNGRDDSKELAEIATEILENQKLINRNKAVLQYLLLYPLIINHPKMSEDEKGQ